MNTGIQDSFNLAWKLALVQRGLASPSLLRTYTEERLPVSAELLNQTTVTQGVLQEAVHPNAYGERALGRCLTLIYASSANGDKCTNVAGQGPDTMQFSPG